jgi:hypothetical protein
MAKVRALRLNVYSNPDYRSCANGGWTEAHDALYVACPEGPWEIEETAPALFYLAAGPRGTIHLRIDNISIA